QTSPCYFKLSFTDKLSLPTRLSAATIEVSPIITPTGLVVSDVAGGVVLLILAVLSESVELSLPSPHAEKIPEMTRTNNIFFIVYLFFPYIKAQSYKRHQWLFVLKKRLGIFTFAGRFVQGVCQCSKNGGKQRFTQACRIRFTFHKMDLDGVWCLTVPDHPIGIKVVFIGYPLLKAHLRIKGISDTVNNASFPQIGCRVRIDHNTAVHCGLRLLYNRIVSVHRQIDHLGDIRIVAKIGRNAAVDTVVCIFPFGFGSHQF